MFCHDEPVKLSVPVVNRAVDQFKFKYTVFEQNLYLNLKFNKHFQLLSSVLLKTFDK